VAIQVEVERLESDQPRTERLKIVVPPEELEKHLRRIAREVSRQQPIAGFRPGKAPYELVVRHFGYERLLELFLNNYGDQIVDAGLKKAGVVEEYPAQIDTIKLEPVTIIVSIPLKPTVELGDYKSLRIPYEPPEVTDEDVEEYLRDTLASKGTMEPVDEPATANDSVEVEITIRIGDETVVDKEVLTVVPGEDIYLPGLSDVLEGMKPGESKTFTLPIPEDHVWHEKGEEAEVTLHVLSVKRLRLPEITPEIIQELGGDVETEEEFRRQIRDYLMYQKEKAAEEAYWQEILERLKEQSRVEFSPLLAQRLAKSRIEDLAQYLEQINMPFETYLELIQKTKEELTQRYEKLAEEELKEIYLLEEIAKREKLEIEEEDLTYAIIDLAAETSTHPESIAKALTSDEHLSSEVYRRASQHRLQRYLMAVAKGEVEEEAAAEAEERASEPESEDVATEERAEETAEETEASAEETS